MTVQQQSASLRTQRARQVARVLWVTLALNWFVALSKLVLGLATHCMVIVADGLHSFSDGLSNIVGLIGMHIAAHPADEDHPYGHQKYETLAAGIIAFFLFAVSFGIFKEAIHGFFNPKVARVNAISFVVMGFAFVVNVFVVVYERRKAKELASDLLSSDSWHTISDLFITLSVFVALGGIYLNIPRIDSLFSFGIALFIGMTGIGILKHSSDILCDKAVLNPEEIGKIVCRVDGVRDCHEIRTRGRKDDVYVDLHVLVDSTMTVEVSHRLANIIENNIRKQIPGVHDVVVHIEPVSHGHDELDVEGKDID